VALDPALRQPILRVPSTGAITGDPTPLGDLEGRAADRLRGVIGADALFITDLDAFERSRRRI